MRRSVRWLRVGLEVVGALCIIALLARWALQEGFKSFAGGNCTDTEQHIISSPDGKRSIKTFHRVCGAEAAAGSDGRGWDFIYLSTGNPNPGYEYTPIADFHNIMPRQVTVLWDSPDQVFHHLPT